MAEGMIRTLKVRKGHMELALNVGFMTATELADTIVHITGIPFRTAHHIVAAVAKTGKTPTLAHLDKISLNIISEKLSSKGLSEKDVKEALDPMQNIKKRKVKGGPSPKETKRQAAQLQKQVVAVDKEICRLKKNIDLARKKLDLFCSEYIKSK
jgi:argininosuccinate lyase